MAYEKLNLKNGDTLTADHLQHLEEGIANAGKGSDLLDENGIIKKEYFPEGFPYGSLQKVTVMPETVLTRDPDSQFYTIPNVLELTQGRQYTVKLSMSVEGETYEYYFPTVCWEAPENDQGFKWVLGNTILLDDEAEDTGEPFLMLLLAPEVAAEAGIGGMMGLTLSLESVTVTITALPANFSFIDPGYVENAVILVKVVGDINSGDFTSSHTPQEMDALLRNGKILMLEHRNGADFYDRNVYTLYNWEPGIDVRFQSTRPTSGDIYVRCISIYHKENKWEFFEVRATAGTVQ